MRAERLFGKPIISLESDPSLDGNINGPSLIKTPVWLNGPLGKYYLYFAHHAGKFIRLAYSDALSGPWKIYVPGTLRLEQAIHLEQNPGHIASPDVHIDDENKRIIMYYHGLTKNSGWSQDTYAAISNNGIDFTPTGSLLGGFYWRVFKWGRYFYSIEMSGRVRRSINGLDNFEEGPVLHRDWDTRHMALKVSGSTLYVFFSIRGGCPESIVVSEIDLSKDWFEWKETPYKVLLEPETDYEGRNLPLEPSMGGIAKIPVRQLRDPAIYEEDGTTYLLYATAGENGIAIAKIYFD